MKVAEKKRIYLSSPTMHGEEQMYVKEAFDTNWVAPLGENVNKFEEELASYVGAITVAALSAGTAAGHLSVKLAEIKQGDIVLCSSLTFAATVNPVVYEKAIPVFIDSEKDTWNMSPKALKKGFEKYPNAKAVVLVNLYGTPAKLGEIRKICDEHNVPLIEDAAESLGATYNGKETGTFGDYGIFSFNGNKIITTSGGGMLVAKDEEKIKKARFLATQAREPARHYQHNEIGYNYRMSNIVAGIGRGQLIHLDEHIARKKKIYETYTKAFADIKDIHMNPYDKANSKPNFWLSCMTIDKNSKVKPLDVMLALESDNIECRPIWKPMHCQPVFEGCDFVSEEEGMDVAAEVFDTGVCLPSDIKNTDEDMDKVIGIVKGLFE